MNDCIFCKIIAKETPAEIVKETPNILVFKDKFPKAAIHLLIVPKRHYRDITEADGEIWSEVRDLANQLAKEQNLKAFRLVHNAGTAAEVPHMHVHFLGEVGTEREI
jgi:histidine triad (HIT) family protein